MVDTPEAMARTMTEVGRRFRCAVSEDTGVWTVLSDGDCSLVVESLWSVDDDGGDDVLTGWQLIPVGVEPVAAVPGSDAAAVASWCEKNLELRG